MKGYRSCFGALPSFRLVSPQFLGAKFIYDKFIEPFMAKYAPRLEPLVSMAERVRKTKPKKLPGMTFLPAFKYVLQNGLLSPSLLLPLSQTILSNPALGLTGRLIETYGEDAAKAASSVIADLASKHGDKVVDLVKELAEVRGGLVCCYNVALVALCWSPSIIDWFPWSGSGEWGDALI